jgi:Domain of unknown function (DUF4145)
MDKLPMKCPHCLQHFFSNPSRVHLGTHGEDDWTITLETCPNCNEAIIILYRMRPTDEQATIHVYPRITGRPPLPNEVPASYHEDYCDAARLLVESPRASAAIGRRCLHRLLRESIGMGDTDLNRQIETLLASKQLPRHLADAIDAVRYLGNFGLYPTKSTKPSEICELALGEAEWLLDTLDGLFNYFFVEPAATERKRAALMASLRVAWQRPVEST